MLRCAIKRATCGSIFDPARIRRELADIETKLADPALWNDPAASKEEQEGAAAGYGQILDKLAAVVSDLAKTS